VDASGNESNLSHSGWINCSAAGSDFTCDLQAGLFSSSPVCTLTVDSLNSGGNVFIEKLDNDELDYQTTSYTSTGGIALPVTINCTRGSDYKQFDQRFIPVVDEFNTNPVEYTPTLGNGGGVATSTHYWSREGKFIHIQGYLEWSSAGSGSTLTVSLPSGLTIDTDYIRASVQNSVHGDGQWLDNGTARKGLNVVYNTTNNFGFEEITNSAGAVTGSFFASGDVLTYNLRFPIVGWSAGKKAFIGNLTPKEFVQTPGSTKPVMYSAKIAADGTVSNEIGDWINGNCTNASPMVCTFNAGTWSSTPPNCTISDVSTANAQFCEFNGDPGTATMSIKCYNYLASDQTTAIEKNVICHGVQ
jgi:hypothetical protein